MIGNMIDVFSEDAFSLLSLTQSLNNMPFIPGRAGQVINWEEDPVNTLVIAIEQIDNVLALVDPSARGAPGTNFVKEKANLRYLPVPHYQIDDGFMADEVQGVRELGTTNALRTLESLVNRRMSQHVRLRMDPTLEHQRIGAIKGLIKSGSGDTLFDLYDFWGVAPQADFNFDLGNASPSSGSLRTACSQVTRIIANAMEGMPYSGIYAFCGDEFFDAFIAHPEVRASYLNQTEASQLRSSLTYGAFQFGDITWENYRGGVGGTPFIATDECRLFPVGTPGFWRTVFAPADYIDTVNTPGLPRYAKQWRMANDKGIHLELQSNVINYPIRPRALVRGLMAEA